MSEEYLSESAVFSCPLGMRFKAKEIANSKAKYRGEKLLTTSAVLTPKQTPIPCTFLPPLPSGSPPCPCTTSPISDNIKHRATMNLLTMNAKTTCAAGQIVKPKLSGTNGHIIHNSSR